MVYRTAQRVVQELSLANPVVVITGPRQSGKTTLARAAFPKKPYVNLERPEERRRALLDPVSFLSLFPEGAVLDEFQRAPELASYIQAIVDEKNISGMYVLTGSQQMNVSEAVSQSLAGRAAMMRLLPFSLEELGGDLSTDELIWRGFYPRIHDRKLDPVQALGDYVENYIERDVRQIHAIRDLSLFRRFLGLCAGRVGALLDVTHLGNDAGISHETARQWLSILEATYILFRLPPWFANLGKRLTKSHKLYFYDVGLAAYLMGIEHASQVATHPLRGELFENMVVMETLKFRYHRGKRSNLFFYRDARHHEIDLLLQYGHRYLPMEVKSGATFVSDYLQGFAHLPAAIKRHPIGDCVVYDGAASQRIRGTHLINARQVAGFLDDAEAAAAHE